MCFNPNRLKIINFLNDIKLNQSMKNLWEPSKIWNKVHGDGYFSTTNDDHYKILTMKDSSLRYIAKVSGASDESYVVLVGVDDGEPTIQNVLDALITKYST